MEYLNLVEHLSQEHFQLQYFILIFMPQSTSSCTLYVTLLRKKLGLSNTVLSHPNQSRHKVLKRQNERKEITGVTLNSFSLRLLLFSIENNSFVATWSVKRHLVFSALEAAKLSGQGLCCI